MSISIVEVVESEWTPSSEVNHSEFLAIHLLQIGPVAF